MEGIALARTEQPDLILMDINLPGMNGFAALRILLADPATMTIPVIALSANAMPRDLARGMQAGFHRYLTKPVRVPDFFESVNAALKASAGRTRPAAAGQADAS
jgi:CheY-like chemotaxis protein